MAHSISEYAGVKGVQTYLAGRHLDRLEIRAFLGCDARKFFGAFACDDGIVAYTERGQARAFAIRGAHH